MQVEAISNISIINTALALYTLSEPLKRRLVELGINAEEVKSDEEAQALISEKEETKKVEKTETATDSINFYDKELIFDIKRLASDLGMYVPEDIDIKEMLYNISMKITHLSALFANNKNLKKVAEEFEDRYQDIYTRYMSKKNFLSTQVVQ